MWLRYAPFFNEGSHEYTTLIHLNNYFENRLVISKKGVNPHMSITQFEDFRWNQQTRISAENNCFFSFRVLFRKKRNLDGTVKTESRQL